MKQLLTRYSFIELFTEDDMCINTMRDLLKKFSTSKQEEYQGQQKECATAIRASVCDADSTSCLLATSIQAPWDLIHELQLKFTEFKIYHHNFASC